MLTLPDLNRLKVFCVVYRSPSLVEAAKTLSVTRSAVSQTLKSLEQEIGYQLFFRTSKRITPTPEAASLFTLVEPLFTDLAAKLSMISLGQKSAAGLLRIGAPQDFGSNFLTDRIILFRREYPKIKFDLQLATPLTLLEKVASGRLDLAFVDNADLHAKDFPVSVKTIFREEFALVCGKRYFENLKSADPPYEELKACEFLDYFPHAPVARIWLKHRFGRSPAIEASFAAENVRALIKAAIGGVGLAVLPKQMLSEELKAGRLKELCAEGKPLVNRLSLVRRLERTQSVREKLFLEFVQKSST